MSESEMTRRRLRPASLSPALPLDDDDLLSDILLRLPPQPSSLPRASLVCNRWHRLVSDPGFLRRFRAHHRTPPLLGFFLRDVGKDSFIPILDPPDRIPSARFSLQRQLDDDEDLRKDWTLLDCRHGLALLLGQEQRQALVWDPATGHQCRVAIPPELDNMENKIIRNMAVLRTAACGDGGCPFQVVLVCTDGIRAFACVYSSESGKWGKIVSTAVQFMVSEMRPSTLVGSRLYWLLTVRDDFLEFDLDTQSLAVIEKPVGAYGPSGLFFQIMPTKDGELGLAILTDHDAQLWERKASSGGLAGWELWKTVQLGEILGLGSLNLGGKIYVMGFAEDVNAIFLWTVIVSSWSNLSQCTPGNFLQGMPWPPTFPTQVSILQAWALVVELMELKCCPMLSMHKMNAHSDLPVEVLGEQVSRQSPVSYQDAEVAFCDAGPVEYAPICTYQM